MSKNPGSFFLDFFLNFCLKYVSFQRLTPLIPVDPSGLRPWMRWLAWVKTVCPWPWSDFVLRTAGVLPLVRPSDLDIINPSTSQSLVVEAYLTVFKVATSVLLRYVSLTSKDTTVKRSNMSPFRDRPRFSWWILTFSLERGGQLELARLDGSLRSRFKTLFLSKNRCIIASKTVFMTV